MASQLAKIPAGRGMDYSQSRAEVGSGSGLKQLFSQLVNLLKLRIGVIMMLTALVAMVITPGPQPNGFEMLVLCFAVLISAGAAGAFNRKKQQVLVHTSAAYLSRYRLWEKPCRYDLITVERVGGILRWRIRHYRDAFQPNRGRQL